MRSGQSRIFPFSLLLQSVQTKLSRYSHIGTQFLSSVKKVILHICWYKFIWTAYLSSRLSNLVSTPLDDKDNSYYTNLYKQPHSYNELLSISANVYSFLVKAEKEVKQTENQVTHSPHTPLIATNKLSTKLTQELFVVFSIC